MTIRLLVEIEALKKQNQTLTARNELLERALEQAKRHSGIRLSTPEDDVDELLIFNKYGECCRATDAPDLATILKEEQQ